MKNNKPAKVRVSPGYVQKKRIQLPIYTIYAYYISLYLMDIFNLTYTRPKDALTFHIVSFIIFALFLLRKIAISSSGFYGLLITLFAGISLSATLIAGSYNSNIEQSLYNFNQYLPFAYLILFLVILGKSTINTKELVKFNTLFIAFVVFCCIQNIVVNYGFILGSFLSISNPYDSSISGFFTNRNTFGYLISLGIAVLLYNKQYINKVRVKLLFYGCMGLMSTSLFLSLSRTSIVMLLIFILTYSYIRNGALHLFKIAAALSSFALIAFAYMPTFITNNVIRADLGDTGRSDLQGFGLNYFKSHNIWFGSGTLDPTNTLISDKGFTSYHSTYITILNNSGLFGMIIFIALILSTILAVRRIYRSDKNSAAFFAAICISYLAYSFYEANPPFYINGNSFILALYLIAFPIYLNNGSSFINRTESHAHKS